VAEASPLQGLSQYLVLQSTVDTLLLSRPWLMLEIKQHRSRFPDQLHHLQIKGQMQLSRQDLISRDFGLELRVASYKITKKE
tara:strand:+ start:458 stop:703 length:246 start_codon:yes stop_codon:yes gene_type:complete